MSNLKEDTEIDYLEVDKPIPGQNYVCLSFISPEKVLKDKNKYFISEFIKSLNKDFDETELEKKYDEFFLLHKDKLQKKFDEINGESTSMRGLKVRGIYDTRKEAEIRAKVLQRMDKSFHVFVGQVGYWLPWDPDPDSIENSEYAEKELNDLVKSYKENEMERDIYYQEQLNRRKEEIIKENQNRKEDLENSSETIDSEKDTEDKEKIQNDLIDNLMNSEDHTILKQQYEDYKNENNDIKDI